MLRLNLSKLRINFIGILLITIGLLLLIGQFSFSGEIENQLPPLQKYPIPATLSEWKDINEDNYFDEIKPHLVGYLLWLKFPVNIYVESPSSDLSTFNYDKFLKWQKIAEKSVSVWQQYFPLKLVQEEKNADILIYRRQPKLDLILNPDTGLYDSLQAKAATTSLKFYLSKTIPPTK